MPKWAITLTAAIILIGLLIGYFGFPRSSDEKGQILSIIAEAEQAANAGQFIRLLRYVAEDYHDSSGYTKRDLKRLALQAEQSGHIWRITATVNGIVVSGRTASVQVGVDVWEAGSTKSEHYDLRLRMVKRRRWYVIAAEGWQKAIEDTAGRE